MCFSKRGECVVKALFPFPPSPLFLIKLQTIVGCLSVKTSKIQTCTTKQHKRTAKILVPQSCKMQLTLHPTQSPLYRIGYTV